MVSIKGLSRAQINAIRLKVKDFLPPKFKGDRSQFKPWADAIMLFLSIEEQRLTAILRQLQTLRQPITDGNVICGYYLEAEAEGFTSLSKVILRSLLSMTKGENLRNHSFIPLVDMKLGGN
eukprot:4452961-Amphidinium_carterae.7